MNEHILDDDKYLYLFSVEEVNKRVLQGVPFRDAYRQVGLEIEAGQFKTDRQVRHTHEGSIGNLCNEAVAARMKALTEGFGFDRVHQAEAALLAE